MLTLTDHLKEKAIDLGTEEAIEGWSSTAVDLHRVDFWTVKDKCRMHQGRGRSLLRQTNGDGPVTFQGCPALPVTCPEAHFTLSWPLICLWETLPGLPLVWVPIRVGWRSLAKRMGMPSVSTEHKCGKKQKPPQERKNQKKEKTSIERLWTVFSLGLPPISQSKRCHHFYLFLTFERPLMISINNFNNKNSFCLHIKMTLESVEPNSPSLNSASFSIPRNCALFHRLWWLGEPRRWREVKPHTLFGIFHCQVQAHRPNLLNPLT